MFFSIDESGRSLVHYACYAHSNSSHINHSAGANAHEDAGLKEDYSNRLEVLALLHDSGADLNPSSSISSLTPLHIAVLYGRVEVVRFLVQAACDLDVPDGLGRNPEQLAHYLVHLDEIENNKLHHQHNQRNANHMNSTNRRWECLRVLRAARLGLASDTDVDMRDVEEDCAREYALHVQQQQSWQPQEPALQSNSQAQNISTSKLRTNANHNSAHSGAHSSTHHPEESYSSSTSHFMSRPLPPSINSGVTGFIDALLQSSTTSLTPSSPLSSPSLSPPPSQLSTAATTRQDTATLPKPNSNAYLAQSTHNNNTPRVFNPASKSASTSTIMGSKSNDATTTSNAPDSSYTNMNTATSAGVQRRPKPNNPAATALLISSDSSSDGKPLRNNRSKATSTLHVQPPVQPQSQAPLPQKYVRPTEVDALIHTLKHRQQLQPPVQPPPVQKTVEPTEEGFVTPLAEQTAHNHQKRSANHTNTGTNTSNNTSINGHGTNGAGPSAGAATSASPQTTSTSSPSLHKRRPRVHHGATRHTLEKPFHQETRPPQEMEDDDSNSDYEYNNRSSHYPANSVGGSRRRSRDKASPVAATSHNNHTHFHQQLQLQSPQEHEERDLGVEHEVVDDDEDDDEDGEEGSVAERLRAHLWSTIVYLVSLTLFFLLAKNNKKNKKTSKKSNTTNEKKDNASHSLGRQSHSHQPTHRLNRSLHTEGNHEDEGDEGLNSRNSRSGGTRSNYTSVFASMYTSVVASLFSRLFTSSNGKTKSKNHQNKKKSRHNFTRNQAPRHDEEDEEDDDEEEEDDHDASTVRVEEEEDAEGKHKGWRLSAPPSTIAGALFVSIVCVLIDVLVCMQMFNPLS